MPHRSALAAVLIVFASAACLFAQEQDPEQEPDQEPDAEAADEAEAAVGDAGEPIVEPGFVEDWNASFSLGFTGTEGNTRSQSFNAQFQADKEDERHRWLWDNKYFYGRSDGDVDQDSFTSRLTKDWLVPEERWFYFARGTYEYDRFRPWEHRIGVFGGPGYDIIRQDVIALTGRAGLGVVREWGDVNDTRPEGLIGLELLRWHITENQNLTASSTLYPNLEDLPRNRVVSAVEWTATVANAENLSLKLGIEHEYESETVDDSDHSDLKYYGALQYSF